MGKQKIQKATRQETQAAASIATAKLEAATQGQLQSALCSLAEAVIELTADYPDDDTRRGLTATLVTATLDAHAGTVALQDTFPLENLEPPTVATN